MNRSTPGLPVRHQLPEFTQTHVHWVSDAIQPSHPLSSPSPPVPNPSQHQGLFQWVNSSHEVTKVLEFQLQHQSFIKKIGSRMSKNNSKSPSPRMSGNPIFAFEGLPASQVTLNWKVYALSGKQRLYLCNHFFTTSCQSRLPPLPVCPFAIVLSPPCCDALYWV